MNKAPYIVVDCPYMCYRAYYSTGGLNHGDIKTGMVFGVLSALIDLKERFKTNRFIMCFDYGKLIRQRIYEPYKLNRIANLTEDERLERIEIKNQINQLREKYLPLIGFNNIFYQKGFEADDIIGMLCIQAKKQKEIVIVSADQDLYQLIQSNIKLYNPVAKIEINIQYMAQKLHIPPNKWHLVKAIAGCSSDNIEGIKGVGDLTAIKYLNNELGEHTKAYQAIESPEGERIIRTNCRLTKLPFPGTKAVRIKKNNFSQTGWKKLIRKLGIESLSKDNPFRMRK